MSLQFLTITLGGRETDVHKRRKRGEKEGEKRRKREEGNWVLKKLLKFSLKYFQ